LLNIKENIIRKKIGQLKKINTDHEIVIKPIKKVVILNNPQSNLTFEMFNFLHKTLGINSLDFDIITFKEKNDHYNELRGIVASNNIFNSFGKIKSLEIQEFIEKDYDLLLDFTGTKNIYEKYLSLLLKANFKVGYYTEEGLYDLMLNILIGDVKNFINETKKYLQILGLLSLKSN